MNPPRITIFAIKATAMKAFFQDDKKRGPKASVKFLPKSGVLA